MGAAARALRLRPDQCSAEEEYDGKADDDAADGHDDLAHVMAHPCGEDLDGHKSHADRPNADEQDGGQLRHEEGLHEVGVLVAVEPGKNDGEQQRAAAQHDEADKFTHDEDTQAGEHSH